VMRHGRRIEAEITHDPTPKKKRKHFWARWVKLPRHWISGLAQSKSASTYQLAHWILLATYEDKRGNREVTLSSKTTMGMPSATRHRSARELVELGLITLEGGGNTTRALRARIVRWRG
jgi:hypothetical protein